MEPTKKPCDKVNHLQPAKWKHVTGKDGFTRAYCANCGKFMGFVAKVK